MNVCRGKHTCLSLELIWPELSFSTLYSKEYKGREMFQITFVSVCRKKIHQNINANLELMRTHKMSCLHTLNGRRLVWFYPAGYSAVLKGKTQNPYASTIHTRKNISASWMTFPLYFQVNSNVKITATLLLVVRCWISHPQNISLLLSRVKK